MTRSTKSSLKFSNVRRNNAKLKEEFLDIETQRQAKRLGRQQKRLEKETGIANVVNINTRQRVVRYEDIKELKPLTDTQYDFFEAWEDDQATGYVLYGSAGVGKTFLAAYHALLDVLDPNKPEYKKLIIIRSSVQGRDQGHLPGDEELKMAAFEAPYHSIFAKLTGKVDAYDKLKDMGKVEFMSSSFMRGDTFDDCIVVVDECQNFSWQELNTVSTRIGKNAKIIFCGDGKQDDLHYKKNDTSGFGDFLNVTRSIPEFRNFKFTSDDVVRSGFVKQWIIACERLGL